MNLQAFVQSMRPAIEKELKACIARSISSEFSELGTMLSYHMGWEGEGAGDEAQGKRIRPLLLLLCCKASGGQWELALPAAAAVELIHNFSLIHDDIQDDSPFRHGRPTVWARWGVPQAINAGDLMFTIAHLEITNLQDNVSVETTVQAAQLLHQTCIRLTQGQYLDISYEKESNLTIDSYWPMVSGKTAALIACCSELGALVAGADTGRRQAFMKFGNSLGLAFQAVDDYLGIWGDSALTGKSTDSDLVSGKKSLPVLFGLSQNKRFAKRWRSGSIKASEVVDLSNCLAEEGAKEYTEAIADRLTGEAINALHSAGGDGEATSALQELANMLLRRHK
jgi:geranylgeranyl diphosphate synthase type I